MLPELPSEKPPPVRSLEGERALGVSVDALRMPTLGERVGWARSAGFAGIELLATGEPWGLHAPGVDRAERARLRETLAPFTALAVQAPYKETFDVTLVSPSSAIRRASVSEIWSVCRFVDALGGGVVLVRTGTPPGGVTEDREREFLAECLTTLDRMAGSHNARLGIANHDHFARLENFRLLEMLALRHTGIALDIAHSGGGEAGAFVRENLARLVHVRVGAAQDLDEGVAAPLRTQAFRGMICLSGGEPDPAVTPEQVLAARQRWEDALDPGARAPLP